MGLVEYEILNFILTKSIIKTENEITKNGLPLTKLRGNVSFLIKRGLKKWEEESSV